ncbi:MAG: RNase adapter RapZ [Anaerolineae bacterium]|nr:RNase adapter RapZ [Gloeobacterales cyanobacterium ES-bin-313]
MSSVDTIVLTSLSGAGGTETLRLLEDLGFLALDHVLPGLISTLVEIYTPRNPRLVLRIDIRPDDDLANAVLEIGLALKASGRKPMHLFLECSDEVLLGRYALSRRPHPWFGRTKSLLGAIQAEREALESVRHLADEVIDTSTLSSNQLRQRLEALVLETAPELPITIMSFGFKHGLPKDAQFVLDIRFLPNPFYLEALRPLSGLDAPVRDYVMAGNQAQETYRQLSGMLQFLLAQYCQDRRSQLLIAIGCTGGQHRSVAFVERLAADLCQEGFRCDTTHRDLKPHPH